MTRLAEPYIGRVIIGNARPIAGNFRKETHESMMEDVSVYSTESAQILCLRIENDDRRVRVGG